MTYPAQGAPVPANPTDVLGKRILAIIIDSLLVSVPLAIIFNVIFYSVVTLDSFFIVWGLSYVVYFLGWLGYFTYFESRDGQTLGKKWMGVKVIREDGQPMDTNTALKRNLMRFVDGICAIGYIIGLADSQKHQRWGDQVAHTLVVDANYTGAGFAAPPQGPPGGYAPPPQQGPPPGQPPQAPPPGHPPQQ